MYASVQVINLLYTFNGDPSILVQSDLISLSIFDLKWALEALLIYDLTVSFRTLQK